MIRAPHLALLFAIAACGGTPQEAPPAPEPTPTAEPEPEPAAKPTLEVPPERAVEVTVLGKTVTGDHIVAPAAGTPEEAIVQSLKLLTAGDFDTWIKDWCHASMCGTPEGIEAVKTHTLPATQGSAGDCLGEDGNSITVTRRDSVEPDGLTRIFVWCGAKRMPAPAALYLVDGRYRVASLSW